jgi:hypothetical protein
MVACVMPMAGLSQTAVKNKDLSVRSVPVWFTLLPVNPIRMLADYSDNSWPVTPAPGRMEVKEFDLEIRSAKNMERVAVIRDYSDLPDGFDDPKKYPKGNCLWGQISKEQARVVGLLPDGDYLAAINADGVRCSNVAALRIQAGYDLKSEPVLKLYPLPQGPGPKLHYIGFVATGPDPIDHKLTNFAATYPTLVVDGIEREFGRIVWNGPVGPLEPGQRYEILLDLDELIPPVDLKQPHKVKARLLKYESAEVVTPVSDTTGLAWDSATPKIEPLPPREISLEGTITGPDGKPGKACDLQLNMYDYRTQCNSRGHYTFEKTPPAIYKLWIHSRPDDSWMIVQRVAIEAGKPQTLDASFVPKFYLTGTVRYEDGAPAPRAKVTATFKSVDGGIEFRSNAQSDKEGRYRIGSPFEAVKEVNADWGRHPKQNTVAGRGDVDLVVERPMGTGRVSPTVQ